MAASAIVAIVLAIVAGALLRAASAQGARRESARHRIRTVARLRQVAFDEKDTAD
jgi:uncharacterized integral membrane protein